MPTEPSVSVVVACFDGLPHLSDQLAALAAQDVDGDWEVIVADNGSTDGSPAEVARWTDRLPVRLVEASGRRGPSHARNVGATVARSEVLLFCDQDDVVGPGYVAAMADAVRAHGFVAAAVDAVTLNPPEAVEAHRGQACAGLHTGLWPWAAGTALGIRRDLFVTVGGFDEALFGATEDTDLCWRVQRDTGVPLRLCDAVVLRYRLRTTARATFRQGRSYGRAGPPFYRKWSASGLSRLGPRLVTARWVGGIRLVLPGRSAAERLRGLFLLGTCVGRAGASVRQRVAYL